ncbi:RNA polymerase sigma factor [Brachybacterium sp. DNPG3]
MGTESTPPPGTAAHEGDELGELLRAGRIDAARQAAHAALDDGRIDETLAVLAARTVAATGTTSTTGTADPDSADAAALELFIEVLDATGVVQRFTGAALLDPDAVEDVAQDSLISIAESIHRFDGRSKVTTWVHTIVRRRVADHLRGRRTSVELEEKHRPAVRMSSMIADRVSVQHLLADLPELYRVPVLLRDLEQLPYAEIAERLGRAEGTVKSQVSRGRAMLAGRLAPAAPDAPGAR